MKELNLLLQDDKRYIDAIMDKVDAIDSRMLDFEGAVVKKINHFELTFESDHEILNKLQETVNDLHLLSVLYCWLSLRIFQGPVIDRRFQEVEKSYHGFQKSLDTFNKRIDEQLETTKDVSQSKFNSDELEHGLARVRDLAKRSEIILENTTVKVTNLLVQQRYFLRSFA